MRIVLIFLFLYGPLALTQTRSNKESVLLTDQEFNARRLLRFTQLWNLFIVRNLDLPPSELQRLQKIMNRTRLPQMNASMPVGQVTQQIENDAKELFQALSVEKLKGKHLDENAANADYLRNRFLPNLNNRKYFSVSKKDWAAEMRTMKPALSSAIDLESPNGQPLPVTTSPQQNIIEPAPIAVTPPPPTQIPPKLKIIVIPDQPEGAQ